MSDAAESIVKNHLAAVRRAIDPHRTLLTASTPYVIAGSIGPADRRAVVAGASAAGTADADYIHLEFEPGAEREGPVNVKVGMIRSGMVHVRESCRFWLGEDGRIALVASCRLKFATMTFDAEGMDSHPGAPAGDLDAGYARAAEQLRAFAAIPAPNDECITITLPRAA